MPMYETTVRTPQGEKKEKVFALMYKKLKNFLNKHMVLEMFHLYRI